MRTLRPHSVQGDRRFPDALAAMGCRVSYGQQLGHGRTDREISTGSPSTWPHRPTPSRRSAWSQQWQQTPTTITGISHLKFKESDRISGTAERLRSLGGKVDVGDDSLTIRPAPLHGGTIDPANDHRTAMSFAVLGLGIGGITITNAECVNKSFPGFWELLKTAGLPV